MTWRRTASTGHIIIKAHEVAGADPGGIQGSKDPPGPQRGGPGPLFQNEENSIYYLQFYLIPPNKSL